MDVSINIKKCLLEIYPDLKDEHFSIVDHSNGKGVQVENWTFPSPQPTEEEILAVWKEIKSTLPDRTIDTIALLGEQLVQERIERMKTKQQQDQIGKQLVLTKLELIQLKGGTLA